jgi:hypothetical protein
MSRPFGEDAMRANARFESAEASNSRLESAEVSIKRLFGTKSNEDVSSEHIAQASRDVGGLSTKQFSAGVDFLSYLGKTR